MYDLIVKFVTDIVTLYQRFGWWCVALIATTFAIMIGVNLLLKLCFKKATTEQLQALRKFLSFATVFVVAIGVIYLFNVIIDKENGIYAISFVVNNCIPVAGCSMFIWTIVKLVGRVGVKPIWRAIAKALHHNFKDILKEIPLDDKIKNILFKQLEIYITSNADDKDNITTYIQENEFAIFKQVETMLQGFAETQDIEALATQFVGAIKSKCNEKEKKQNED